MFQQVRKVSHHEYFLYSDMLGMCSNYFTTVLHHRTGICTYSVICLNSSYYEYKHTTCTWHETHYYNSFKAACACVRAIKWPNSTPKLRLHKLHLLVAMFYTQPCDKHTTVKKGLYGGWLWHSLSLGQC